MDRKDHVPMVELLQPVEFEWDEWNIRKNRLKHRTLSDEIEQAFTDPQKKIFADVLHSKKEDRYIGIGKTNKDRILYIVFTIRNKKRVRVISARDLNRKERSLYP